MPERLQNWFNNPSRITNGSATIWYINQDDSHGSNFGSVSDTDPSKKLCIGTNIYVITDKWGWSIRYPIAYGHTLTQCAIAADNNPRVNENVAKMVNTQTTANLGVMRQTYTSKGFD